jgi:hypothetical protein
MRRIALLSLFTLLSACALVQHRYEPVPWPSDVSFLEGEGDLDLTSPKEHFTGSFAIRMSYPDHLFFEVYGSFGQTLMHIEKDDAHFLLIAGDQKTSDEGALLDRFGFAPSELMDDLALKGEKRETSQGLVTVRNGYEVLYNHDRRGRRNMCWERQKEKLCLTFSDVKFAGE